MSAGLWDGVRGRWRDGETEGFWDEGTERDGETEGWSDGLIVFVSSMKDFKIGVKQACKYLTVIQTF